MKLCFFDQLRNGSPCVFDKRFFVVILMMLTTSVFVQRADAATKTGRIIQEARCKVLIRGRLDVSAGDELSILPKLSPGSRPVGKVQVLKNKGSRLIGRVVGTFDCRRFRGMYVSSGSLSKSSSRKKVSRKGPPPILKLMFGGGPGLSNATFSGISRDSIVEDYPLILTSLDLGLEAYPFSFMSGASSWQNVIGLDAGFRYVTSLSNVQATTPNPGGEGELDLEMSFKRLHFKTGAIVRLELWKKRLFADARAGYYFSRTTSTLEQLINADAAAAPIEISPLRDLGLTGFYAAGGFQFQPTTRFRARMNVGTVLGTDYQIDNRLFDAKRDSPALAEPVDAVAVFLLDSSLGYSLGKVLLGVNFSLEKYTGEARYPNKSIATPGFVSEQFINYSLNASYLL